MKAIISNLNLNNNRLFNQRTDMYCMNKKCMMCVHNRKR